MRLITAKTGAYAVVDRSAHNGMFSVTFRDARGSLTDKRRFDCAELMRASLRDWRKSENSKILRASIRQDKKTGEFGLFFYVEKHLTCYFHVGQHSSASVEYMRECTRAVNPENLPADALDLIAEYESLGGIPCKIEILRRLKRG